MDANEESLFASMRVYSRIIFCALVEYSVLTMTNEHPMLDLATIRAVMFDMDGVLYRGPRALPGVNDIFTFLEQHAIPFACVTNNAGRTAQQVSAALEALSIVVPAANIVTSAVATSTYLRSIAPRGTAVYAVGMAGLLEPLFADGYFVPDEKTPRFVVVGLDTAVTYDKLRIACLAIRAGATFVGTNPDRTFPADDGIVPGAGALLAALVAATDQQPLIIGKPSRAMFDSTLKLLAADAATTLMVGDRYDTDIVGAARADLHTAMVLTGISTRAEGEAGHPPPDLIVDDLPALLALWQSAVE